MYQVAADINDVEVKRVSLDQNFNIDADLIRSQVNKNTKLIFLCSPNNPTGNSLNKEEMKKVIRSFEGLVILDEAYIDFAPDQSLLPELDEFPNLVILQTFSKAWGMAGIRLGMAFAATEIIQILNRIKYPYNLNILTQQKALELLNNTESMSNWVELILKERGKVIEKLQEFPFVVKIYPSDANFILVKMHDARGIYEYLVENGIIVRDRSKVYLCEDSLRITIGTENENTQLIKALNSLIEGTIQKINK